MTHGKTRGKIWKGEKHIEDVERSNVCVLKKKKANKWRDIGIETQIQEVLRSPSRTNHLKIHLEVHHDKKAKKQRQRRKG